MIFAIFRPSPHLPLIENILEFRKRLRIDELWQKCIIHTLYNISPRYIMLSMSQVEELLGTLSVV